MNNGVGQKLDLILTEQKKLRLLVDKVEVNLLDEIEKNRKEIKKVKVSLLGEIGKNRKAIEDNQKEIKKVQVIVRETNLESHSRSAAVA